LALSRTECFDNVLIEKRHGATSADCAQESMIQTRNDFHIEVIR
jgi:hypothetical protein